MVFKKDGKTIEHKVTASLDDKFIQLVNDQYTDALAVNLEGAETAEAKDAIRFELDRRKQRAFEDELETRLSEALINETLELNNQKLLTEDKLTGRKIYVNMGNPTMISVVSGFNISQATIQGSFFHLLNKFVKQNTLWIGELDNEFKTSIVTNFGLTLVNSKRNKSKNAMEGNFNAVGAKIYTTNTQDILFVAAFNRMMKDAPVVSVFEQFTYNEAKAIIENMEEFEKALKEKEEN